ncbi:ArsA family ATPase [Paraconexibacter sp.]|uniref:ArsA family ATPase n=1 Tax=Paraconexibacter sp. TaxID=2949640 RepID=UPI003567CCA0
MNEILNHNLIVVTGKGGVGKTTVAAALGMLTARAGGRTIVCEVGAHQRLPDLFGVTPGDPGDEIRLSDGLFQTSVDPMLAIEEWIGRQLGSRSLTQVLARSNAFQYFVAAAPGAREVLTISKAWELGQDARWDKNASGYDHVIIDAPASGHGVGLLRSPSTISGVTRGIGPVAGQAHKVRDALHDEATTAYVAVTLASELPVTETLELDGLLSAAVGRGPDTIICNAVLPRRFTGRDLQAVAEADGAVDDAVRRATLSQSDRVREQQSQLRRLRKGATAPVVTLPFVPAPELELEDVRALADELARRA